MSYHGTVHCSYCGKRGHNRLGCPERHKAALENPDSYVGRQVRREQEKRQRAIASRVCSYCKQPGHNRRGCETLKEDKRLVLNRQHQYLESFAALATDAGLGPGSLMRVPEGHRSDPDGVWSKGYVAMITNINWENIDFMFEDTKMLNNWSSRSTKVMSSRIVKTFGYENYDTTWNRAPAFNDIRHLTMAQLHGILEGVITPEIEMSSSDKELQAQLVSPVSTRVSLPTEIGITRRLNDVFHFNPGPRADEYDKQRPKIHQDCWSKVRPLEYKPSEGNKW